MTSPTAADRDDLVSIVTPAFRAGLTISDTIRSVADQHYQHWEMLIADDCSPDNTRAVISEWMERDPRVRLLPMPENGGPAAARNLAITQARGRWLAFLDADDLWLPEKLVHQLRVHREAKAKISFTAFRRITAVGDITGRLIHVPTFIDYYGLLANTAIATSTVIVDRDRSGAVVMKPTYYDDFACWLDMLRSGGHAVGLNQDLMRYRVQAASVSRNKRKSAMHVWRTYRDVEGLGILPSLRYFGGYAWRGLWKYRRF